MTDLAYCRKHGVRYREQCWRCVQAGESDPPGHETQPLPPAAEAPLPWPVRLEAWLDALNAGLDAFVERWWDLACTLLSLLGLAVMGLAVLSICGLLLFEAGRALLGAR